MKNIRSLLTAFAIGAFCMASCSDDDDNSNTTPADNITGTYTLTEFNTATATDLDMDGTPHINQKLETDCYNNTKMIFSANNTVVYQMNSITIDENTGLMNCTSNTFAGTWQIESGSSTLGVINIVIDVNGNPSSISLNKEGNEITNFQLFSEYADINSSGNGFYNSGEITMVFVKQ